MSLPHVFLPSRTRSCRSMWLCFREPQGQGHYRHHPFFPPFSCWRPVVLHRLGQYPHENPGSSQGTWVRRRYIQDNCIFQQHLTQKGEITWSHPLSSGVTESFPHLLDSLPVGRLTTSCGLKISFLWRACLFVGKINLFLNPSLPWSVCVKDPSSQW